MPLPPIKKNPLEEDPLAPAPAIDPVFGNAAPSQPAPPISTSASTYMDFSPMERSPGPHDQEVEDYLSRVFSSKNAEAPVDIEKTKESANDFNEHAYQMAMTGGLQSAADMFGSVRGEHPKSDTSAYNNMESLDVGNRNDLLGQIETEKMRNQKERSSAIQAYISDKYHRDEADMQQRMFGQGLLAKEQGQKEKDAEAQRMMSEKDKQLQAERDFKASEAEKNRKFRGGESERDRKARLEQEKLRGQQKSSAPGGKNSNGSKITSTAASQIGLLDSAYPMIDNLNEEYLAAASDRWSGVSSLQPGSKANLYDAKRRSYAQSIGTTLEQGKLSDKDYDKYYQMLPSPFDVNSKAAAKIAALKDLIEMKKAGIKKGLEESGYDTSKIQQGAGLSDYKGGKGGLPAPNGKERVPQGGNWFKWDPVDGKYKYDGKVQ